MAVGLALTSVACSDDRLVSEPGSSTGGSGSGGAGGAAATAPLRVAQYNIYFLGSDMLAAPSDWQLDAAVDVINRHDPDVLAVNEFEYDLPNGPEPPGSLDGGQNAQLFASKLSPGAVDGGYDHTLQVMTNQGQPWQDYQAGTHDPYFQFRGLGNTVGPINYAVVSRYPILKDQVRVVTEIAWTDLPGNISAQATTDTGITVPPGYPLFSKAVAIVPIDVEGETVFLVMLHTIPPVFHELNAYRNRDELVGVRLLLEGGLPGEDPLPSGARFVLLGDFNSDPDDGDSFGDSVQPLLSHPLLHAFQPEGSGTVGNNAARNTFEGACPLPPPAPTPGLENQFQLDFLLPSVTFAAPRDGGVFFPDHLTATDDWALACAASDHMLVWADLPL